MSDATLDPSPTERLFTFETASDPHPTYHALLRECPVADGYFGHHRSVVVSQPAGPDASARFDAT